MQILKNSLVNLQKNRFDMISLEKAINLTLENALILETETISYLDSLNRILAEDVYSDIDIPPFNKSAMDGYACKKIDIDKPLKVIQTVQAGEMPVQFIGDGECVKIMTGARIPENADYVAKIEDTYIDETGKVYIQKIDNKTNIRYKAEDIRQNDCVLNIGTLIRPSEIATLATVGKTNVSVYKKPIIAIASTGNELVEPDLNLLDYQIRNSNAYQLIALCKKMMLEPHYTGIIKDDMQESIIKIKQMLSFANVIILTGGVSMGDFDLIPKALEQLGFNIIFHSIAVQPGKPTLFAKKDKQFIFGLPGNPVSSYMQFDLIVKPFLYKLMNYTYQPLSCLAKTSETYLRKKAERTSLVPVKIENSTIKFVEYHGSAHLFALNEANGFITIPSGVTEIPQNSYVTVRLFS